MFNYFNFLQEDIYSSLILIISIITSYLFNFKDISILLIILFLIILWLYRIPFINIPYYNLQSDEIYSPAYGVIKNIQENKNTYKITIDISCTDIYQQYYPVSGSIIEQIYTSFSLITTIKNIMWGTNIDDRIIKIIHRKKNLTQNIKLYKPNNPITASDKLSFTELGGYIDLEFSKKYKLNIKIGDYVNGPFTKIAKWI
jgi:hypothetical protein